MAQTGQRIYKDCTVCFGTGRLYDHNGSLQSKPCSTGGDPEVACPTCSGLGIIPWGWLRDEKETTMPGEEA